MDMSCIEHSSSLLWSNHTITDFYWKSNFLKLFMIPRSTLVLVVTFMSLLSLVYLCLNPETYRIVIVSFFLHIAMHSYCLHSLFLSCYPWSLEQRNGQCQWLHWHIHHWQHWQRALQAMVCSYSGWWRTYHIRIVAVIYMIFQFTTVLLYYIFIKVCNECCFLLHATNISYNNICKLHIYKKENSAHAWWSPLA